MGLRPFAAREWEKVPDRADEGSSLHPPENHKAPDQRQHEAAPEGVAVEAEPGKEDKAGAEMGDEEPVAARGIEGKNAPARIASGRIILPNAHDCYGTKDIDEEKGGGPGPGHP